MWRDAATSLIKLTFDISMYVYALIRKLKVQFYAKRDLRKIPLGEKIATLPNMCGDACLIH